MASFRRHFVQLLTTAGGVGLVGCINDGPTPGSPQITNQSFKVVSTNSGTGKNHATVTRNDNRVIIKGTIDGRNSCYTAKLEQVHYNEDADELTVSVRSYEPESAGACADVIVNIDYRASVTFKEGLPAGVTVRHNGNRVTSK